MDRDKVSVRNSVRERCSTGRTGTTYRFATRYRFATGTTGTRKRQGQGKHKRKLFGRTFVVQGTRYGNDRDKVSFTVTSYLK